MKNFKFFKSGFCEKLKLLLIPIGLLIGSMTTQVWGWYYIVGDPVNDWNAWKPDAGKMNSSNTITFMAMDGKKYFFRMFCDYDSDTKKQWDQPCGSINSASGDGLLSSGKESGDCGAMWVETDGVCNITFTVSGKDKVDISVQKCAYYIKYPWWGESGWKWSGALADCLDGSNYFTTGNYNGADDATGFCYGRKNSDGGADCNTEGGSDYPTVTTRTTKGNPNSGDYCYFIYNPTNHTLDIRKPHNVTQPNYIYFDNSIAQWTNDKIYVCIGHSKATPWLNVHETEEVEHTKLRYTLNSSSWTDAAYYAMIGTGSGGWEGGSGKSYASFVDAEVRSAVNWDYYNMETNHVYLINMASGANGSPISITDKSTGASSLNSTQTIKYSISRNGGSTYAEQTDGVTPAQITLSTYKFVDETYHSVTSASSSISGGQSSTYNTSVYAAYTGETTLSYTSKRDGYTFIGWFNAASGGTALSSPYYPTTDGSVFARFKAHRYNIEFDANDAQYSTAPAATGSTTTMSNVVYDQNATLTTNGFEREGYSFAGWATTPTGDVDYSNGQSVSNLSATDGATVTLYAKWTEDTHTVTLTNDGHGHVEIDASAETEVSGIGITTASSEITAVANTGYHFESWTGDINNGVTIASGSTTSATITINATADSKTITANFAGNEYTVTFDQEGGEGGSANVTATFGSDMPAITLPHKIGYKFDGYWDGDNGTGNQYYNADGTSKCAWNKASTATLHAKWGEDSNEFTNAKSDGNWNDPDNWSAGVVPTNSYVAVQLSGELNVSSYIHVGSMDLTASGAKLTIQAGGTLEVAGTITNTDPDKLVIQTGNEGQGALIYDITKTAPHATVNMTTKNAAGSHYQYIASPIGGVSVADVFSGKGAYTYVWKEGAGWERRGYYDDIAAFEPIALKGKGSCSFVGQLYPGTTSLSLSYTGTPTNADAQGVNMLANALTAPIKIAAMTISGSSDGSVHVWNDGIWDHSAVASAVEDVIPAMQVYAILASSSGSVSFDYETAVRGASDKNAALKAPKRIASDIPEHITISVRTNERDIDLQLYEDEMFTNEIDKGWEAIYMEGDGRFGELYAQVDEKMSILATPDLEGTILGFAPGETSDYTISFNGDGKGYYLNDMKELKSTLISEDNTYMFSPDESTNATRFVISRTPIHKVPTGTENVSAGTNARKQMINGVLYIIRDGRIYNAEGALVK